MPELDLRVEIGSLSLKNPTILAAGILGTTAGSLIRIASLGAGAVVTKSIGSKPREGYPNPVIVQMEFGLLNAMGLPNPSYKEFKEEIKRVKKAKVTVIASIFGGSVEEFVEVAIGICKAKPSALELNLSCPHAKGYGADIGIDPELVRKITRAVKKEVKVPVWVKLTPNVTDIVEIGRAAERGGADAIVAINTLRGMAIDLESGYPILSNKIGGLSGKALKPVAIRCVYELYENLNIPIIGVGGISNYRDALEFIMAGAIAVQIGTAVYSDLTIFHQICSGIKSYLMEKKCTLEEIRGKAHGVRGYNLETHKR
ncbi:MAG: dihydroorotate dehydrogenase [Methanocellales archaeon]